MNLHEQCLARHKQGGVRGVNRFLHEQYPDPSTRVRAMHQLEDTGPWKINWHYPRRQPDKTPDDGVVWSSGEWNEVSLLRHGGTPPKSKRTAALGHSGKPFTSRDSVNLRPVV